jgi:hypothetical protein
VKAAFITFGVAAGVAAVVGWGSFDTVLNTIMSLTMFPIMLGIGFLLVQVIVSLLRARFTTVKSVIALLFIAGMLLLFPYLYAPDIPVDEQISRLAIIPISLAAAVILSYLFVRWLESRRPAYAW